MTHVHYIAEDQIAVAENRQRKDFSEEAIKDLAVSIAKVGLLHSIIVRVRKDGTVELVAGERRLRAIRQLHAEGVAFFHNSVEVMARAVPCTYTHEVDPIQLKEIELEENVKRVDLSVMEQSMARKELFDLRREQAQARGETYTMADLSNELQKAGVSSASLQVVSRQLRVAEHMSAPAVRNAKTLTEAEKAARKENEKLFVSALAGMLEKEPEPDHKLMVGDCLQIIPTLATGVFDCVLTDPPYGIGIHASGDAVANAHHYDDSPEALEEILRVLPEELWRITRPMAHVYWFCDPRWFERIRGRLTDAGFEVWHRPIIWHKRGKSMVPDMTKWPRQTCEWIVYAIKGAMPPLRVADDLIATPYGSDLQQAEKPKELYVDLLSRSVQAGCHVIDPFCGSGVMFDAARELKLHATGIEKDEVRADLARIRVTGDL